VGRVSLAGVVGKYFELSDNFKIWGEEAFKRITSGLIKLLFPDKAFDKLELELVASIAPGGEPPQKGGRQHSGRRDLSYSSYYSARTPSLLAAGGL